MPRIPGTTDAQSAFLRAFAKHPMGPPPDQWPRPSILRRWLRRPAFRRALDSIRQTLHYQADFHLACAANATARKLQQPLDHPADKTTLDARKLDITLLRLSHLHQRFAPEPPPPPPVNPDRLISQERHFLRRVAQDLTVRDALQYLDRYAPSSRRNASHNASPSPPTDPHRPQPFSRVFSVAPHARHE